MLKAVLPFMFFLASACSGSGNLIQSPPKDQSVEYVSIFFPEPLTIQISDKTISFSDYDLSAQFCPETTGMCVLAPFVTASTSKLDELERLTLSKEWVFQRVEIHELSSFYSILVISPNAEQAWRSVFVRGEEYPRAIVDLRLSSDGAPSEIVEVYVLVK